MTIDELASRAGVGKGTIYLHWRSREEVFHAVSAREAAAMTDAIVGALRNDPAEVALHRYLRWRVPGHDPDADLAGFVYLFLRGMTGADAPLIDGAPPGVFGWRPPPGLVVALSDVLDCEQAAQ